MSNYSWLKEAKCANDEALQEELYQVRKGFGIDPFFSKPETLYGEWAKQYCSGCPVRLACLAEAMKSLDGAQIERLEGIWGGLTSRSRIRLKKKQQEQILLISERMKAQFQEPEIRTEGEVA